MLFRSACEIQAFDNLPGSRPSWSDVVKDMPSQPWWTGFAGTLTSLNEDRGRSVVLTVLTREASAQR